LGGFKSDIGSITAKRETTTKRSSGKRKGLKRGGDADATKKKTVLN